MSLLPCHHCAALIDTDDDPAAFVELPAETVAMCEGCRERWADEVRAGNEVDGANDNHWLENLT